MHTAVGLQQQECKDVMVICTTSQSHKYQIDENEDEGNK